MRCRRAAVLVLLLAACPKPSPPPPTWSGSIVTRVTDWLASAARSVAATRLLPLVAR